MTHDKVKWHIDGGEDEVEVLQRFQSVFVFLDENDMLTEKGRYELLIGVSETTVIYGEQLTPVADEFLAKYYDKAIELNPNDMRMSLGMLLQDFEAEQKL